MKKFLLAAVICFGFCGIFAKEYPVVITNHSGKSVELLSVKVDDAEVSCNQLPLKLENNARKKVIVVCNPKKRSAANEIDFGMQYNGQACSCGTVFLPQDSDIELEIEPDDLEPDSDDEDD